MKRQIDSAADRCPVQQNQGEYSVESVPVPPQPEKSGRIRTEFCLLTMKKVKLIDNRVDLHRE